MFNRFNKSFKPQFHPERLDEPMRFKKPSRIFVGSVTDMFADWMPEENVHKTLEIVKQCPQHTFLFLTKSPNNYHHFKFPDNCWCGATYTGEKPNNYPIYRKVQNLFWSFEPIIEPLDDYWFNGWDKWIIIGAMTGKFAKHYPVAKETIEKIIEATRHYNKPLFMKSNLKPYWNGELIQEYPG